ncbi:Crp/Fnr family transcriptional regulator [Pedobacter caeni]|uniref:cAMP-binding domain of CRP or a regulatory subunit of cAMP-dependent protein kinases n=1 Tax=Pedobacter caeni TaxID=288992 RepID=A0A1M5GLI4_9SPHI|nr:cyclic nucleotide-binding domain-containing protein [Pedobacter caeni]SHG04567.1 cAMP-binding domain of CRP or a regulatory subunit of cAMP-dependent protein kinases [Pedobacter caeni]
MFETHFLHSIFNPKDFNKEELDQIISMFKRLEFRKNEYLLKEGRVADRYWFLQNGFLRSFVTDIRGKDTSTNFYCPGDIAIEWSSLFLKSSTRENIQALTDSVCWEIDLDSFKTLFHGIESFREQGRLTLAGSYFALKNHSIAMIADDARVRYLRLLKEKPLVIQNVPLKYIATYLGITDTSLSRIRKDIAKE